MFFSWGLAVLGIVLAGTAVVLLAQSQKQTMLRLALLYEAGDHVESIEGGPLLQSTRPPGSGELFYLGLDVKALVEHLRILERGGHRSGHELAPPTPEQAARRQSLKLAWARLLPQLRDLAAGAVGSEEVQQRRRKKVRRGLRDFDKLLRSLREFTQAENVRFTDEIRWTGMGTALLLLLVCAWNFWLLRRQLLVPLKRLGEGFDRVAAGDLGTELGLVGGSEMRHLANHFNAMSRALERESRAGVAAQLIGSEATVSNYRGVGVFDESLCLVHADASFEGLLGLHAGQQEDGSEGRTFDTLIESPLLRKAARAVLKNGVTRRRLTLGGADAKSKSDSLRWLSLHRKEDRTGKMRLLIVVENPSQVVRHAELEALQAAALESVSDAMVITDLEGKIEMVNAAFTRVTGYSREEALGQRTSLLKSGEVPLEVYQELWSSLQAGQPWSGRLVNRRKDGTLYHVHMNISPMPAVGGEHSHYVAVQQDVSAFEASRLRLRQSEANFRTLIDESPDGVAVHREGRIVFANPALSQMLGYEEGALVGSKVRSVIYSGDWEMVQARVNKMGEDGKSSLPIEERFVRKDESTILVEVMGWPTTFEGQPSIIALIRDITAKKRLVERAMAADRMSAVGTLAAGVGHEINNPLAYLTANLEYLEEILTEDGPQGLACEEAQEVLQESIEGARRIARIVSHLKALELHAPGTQGKSGSVNLRAILQNVVALANNNLRHRATLSVELEELPLLQGDAAGLSQVFLNLLSNAAQALPAGAASENAITIRGREREGRVEIEVEDTGVGIPQKDMQAIFDPFFTTQPVGEGTGLGLSLSRQVLEAHGGQIEIESVVGEGTCVRVSLPVAGSEQSESSIGSVAREPPNEARSKSTEESLQMTGTPSKKSPTGAPLLRVLVIDDDPPVGRSIQRVLGSIAEVSICERGQEALQRIRAGERPEVILCDLMMPDLTGMSLHQTLEEEYPDLASRMVFITGGAFTPEAKRFADANRDRLLSKPFDLHELRQFVLDRVD